MTCGLIGRRLGHSYSPQIHRALADYDYKLWELEPEELETFFRHQDFTGVNVTIPYKTDALAACDSVSPEAAKIGSVNTVINRNGAESSTETTPTSRAWRRSSTASCSRSRGKRC